jgi:DNA-directed RNA polymerase alpha subunit
VEIRSLAQELECPHCKKKFLVSTSIESTVGPVLIEELSLSVRAYNIATGAFQSGHGSCRTVAELCQFSARDLYNRKNCGRKTVDEIKAELARHGLRLAEHKW